MKKKYQKIFYDTLRIRLIELEIANRYKQQKMRCPVHLSIGQEAVPVGIASNLNYNDKNNKLLVIVSCRIASLK